MDEQIRAIQEYVYSKYIEPADHGELDEEAAARVLEEYYARPEQANDTDCYFPGVLYFELGYEIEEKQIEYFKRAKYWLDRYRAITSEEWDVVDDRLLDIADVFEEHGIEAETEVVTVAPTRAPHVVEEIDDHGPMMLVSGGTFLFGPQQDEVNLAPFYIDKFPVTNREYEAFCRATGYRWPKYMKDERFNDPDAPVVGVSLADAMRFCRWVGKDLPTEEQWEKACRGSDGRAYPWGDDDPTNGLVCNGRDPATGGTDPVTSHPEAASPYGVFEMAGNVWEWTATVLDDGEPVHVVKGGCFNDPPDLVRGDIHLLAAPKDKYETIGFRCVKLGVTPAVLAALVRPFTLLAPVVGVATAAGVAAAALDRPYATFELLRACLAAAAATGASNAWNQVFDLEIDRTNKPTRPLPSGRITKRGALAVGDVLALLALILSALVSPTFLACVAFGLLVTWAYSAPPLRLKRSTVGALLAIALPRGLLVPVAGWAVVAPPDRSDPWALGAIAGLFVLGAAATKDFADVEGDRAHGCRTLPVVWGLPKAARFVAPFLVLPFVLYPVFGALEWLHAPVRSLLALAAALILIGGWTARSLMRNPSALAGESGRSHPAWWGMYLLLLASQVGVLVVYAV